MQAAAPLAAGPAPHPSRRDTRRTTRLLVPRKRGFGGNVPRTGVVPKARVFDTTGDTPQKIYRGQQLVIFGRYEGAGPTTVTLRASLTGEDKTYTTTVNFPETDTDNPEIERLWAMSLIEQIEVKESAGLQPAAESHDAIQNLGVAYQIVTDYTSMVVLDDATHAKRGITRNNQQRTATERTAQIAYVLVNGVSGGTSHEAVQKSLELGYDMSLGTREDAIANTTVALTSAPTRFASDSSDSWRISRAAALSSTISTRSSASRSRSAMLSSSSSLSSAFSFSVAEDGEAGADELRAALLSSQSEASSWKAKAEAAEAEIERLNAALQYEQHRAGRQGGIVQASAA